MIPPVDLIQGLAVRRPGTPVLSVYVRTDPRDPANTAAVPGWLVELRNCLREVSRDAGQDEPRDERLALRELRERVERDVLALEPGRRGRGLAWFLTADGGLDQRFTLQLPPASTLVRWDDLPFVSPLVEVADRGRPAGLVLVSTEVVRLLHWQAGRVAEPARSLYEIQVGQWRDYDAYVGHPGRSPAGMHVAEFDQRVQEWRQRFLRTTAPGGRPSDIRPGLGPDLASYRATGYGRLPPGAARTGSRTGSRRRRSEPAVGGTRGGRRPARGRCGAGPGPAGACAGGAGDT